MDNMDSGWLLKQGNSIRKGWRPRWFWIDHETHTLKYAEKQGEKPLGSIAFATVQARVNNSSMKPFAIDFITPNRTYYVAAKSQEEQLAWIDLFRRATKAAIDGVSIGASNPLSQPSNSSHVSPSTSKTHIPTLHIENNDQSHASTPIATSNQEPPLSPSSATKLTDFLNELPVHRPVNVAPSSPWSTIRPTTERGVLFIKDSFSGQYTKKIAEVRGDNLFLYSNEEKASQRRNSSSPILLTLCQVRPGRRGASFSGDPIAARSQAVQTAQSDDSNSDPAQDDLSLRQFSVVTPSSTLYFMAQTTQEASKWIRVFAHIHKLSRDRARADSITSRAGPIPKPKFTITPAPNQTPKSTETQQLTINQQNETRFTTSPRMTVETSLMPSEKSKDSNSPRITVETSLMPSVAGSQTNTSSVNDDSSSTLTTSTTPSPRYEIPSIEDLDEHMRKILQIASQEGNNKCADCRDPEPQWASLNLGIFICLECSGIHRSLGVHISKVRSIDLDRWDQDMIRQMESQGNIKSNAIYEASLSRLGKHHPEPHSSRSEKETYILSKYMHKAFVEGASADTFDQNDSNRRSSSLAALMYNEGYVNVCSENEKNWRQRWVVLKDNKLFLFKDRAAPEARHVIPLVSAHVKSTTLDRVNTFELVIPKDVFYLQADNSSDFFNWMEMIRTSQKLCKEISSQEIEESTGNDGEVTKKGWMFKQGESIKNWKKRWFVLKDNKLSYYSSPAEKHPKGSIALALSVPKDGTHEPGTPIKGVSDSTYCYIFELVVTGRVYYIATTSAEESKAWIEAIRASKKAHENKLARALTAKEMTN